MIIIVKITTLGEADTAEENSVLLLLQKDRLRVWVCLLANDCGEPVPNLASPPISQEWSLLDNYILNFPFPVA